MARAYCSEGNHYPEYLLCFPAIAIDEEGAMIRTEEGVLLENDGKCSNLWADGTRGVQKDIREMVEAEEEPVCAEHVGCYITWIRDEEN